jgi:uncharacterized protein (TIGR00288 family)
MIGDSHTPTFPMASNNDNPSMAVFCDFENLALGVRDAQYDKFDIRPVLERLLLKGSIVVKKAYCDWERYKGFKAVMHEANFELIEIPHVRQSGKNSADIRLVVDALDLCYTKTHVDTFVILSGDSDFSPLVSKLRENAKKVIGVGIKQSTSDLLVANCDEFIFYDELVRESQRRDGRRDAQNGQQQSQAPRRSPEEEKRRRDEQDVRRTKGVELAVETFEALQAERGDSGKIWASVLKEAIKRRKPDFSESNYGFRAFGNLLEEASARGLLEFGRDEKSGAYVFRGTGTGTSAAARQDVRGDEAPRTHEAAGGDAPATEQRSPEPRNQEPRTPGIYEARAMAQRQAERAPRDEGRNSRHHFNEPLVHNGPTRTADNAPQDAPAAALADAQQSGEASVDNAVAAEPREAREPRRRSRGGRGRNAGSREESRQVPLIDEEAITPSESELAPATEARETLEEEPAPATVPAEAPPEETSASEAPTPAKRPRRPRKPAAPKGDAA